MSPTPISDRERIRAAMAASDGTWPDYWDPQPGDVLSGTVERLDVGQTKLGERRIIVVSADDTGELVSVWLTRSVLASELEKAKPREGDWVCVKYHGVREPKRADASPFHGYSVRVVRANRPRVADDAPDDLGYVPPEFDAA
jgi:hypothetical protein